MDKISIVQAITLAIAVLGAVLGVINTWLGLDKSRVKLRVAPAHVSSGCKLIQAAIEN